MKHLVFLCSLLLPFSGVTAQTALNIELEASLSSADLVKVHLIVPAQTTDLMSIQGTIEFNPQLCVYQSAMEGSVNGLTVPTTGQVEPGMVGFSWLVDDGSPVGIIPGDTLVTFEFSPLVSNVNNASFSLTSNGLAIEFIGGGFSLFDVSETMTTLSWDTGNEPIDSSTLSFTGYQLENGTKRLDLQSNEDLELLSCQGTVHWETPGTVTSIGSNVLSNLDFQDASIGETALGWSWFNPSILPVSVAEGEPLLSIWIDFDEPVDSMVVALNSSLIEIEFIGIDFNSIAISPLEEVVIFAADTNSNGCTNCILGCTYSLACNYNPLANSDDGSCSFPVLGYDCNGNCTFDIDQDGVCDFDETFGCTYPDASNFNPTATQDNGLCLFQLESSCPTDVDLDGVTGVSDILTVLSNFGLLCQ